MSIVHQWEENVVCVCEDAHIAEDCSMMGFVLSRDLFIETDLAALDVLPDASMTSKRNESIDTGGPCAQHTFYLACV